MGIGDGAILGCRQLCDTAHESEVGVVKSLYVTSILFAQMEQTSVHILGRNWTKEKAVRL